MAAAYAVGYLALFELGWRLPSGYQPSRLLFALAAMVSLLEVVFLAGSRILFALKQTRFQAVAAVFSALVTMALSLVWVGPHGVQGLIAALVAGAVVLALVSNLLAAGQLRRRQRADGSARVG